MKQKDEPLQLIHDKLKPDHMFSVSLQGQLQSIVQTNEYTRQFGLSLTEADAELLMQERFNTLKNQNRVEFGEGILPKFIFTFCDSPYISSDDYVDTLIQLQEMFYLYKNESMDEVTDDELLAFMKQAFDGVCQGSLEYLEETILDAFARGIRRAGVYCPEE